ncbi:MAG: murein DD-endopeptidase MepM/ murein hydrolase activator NlpD [Gammaproteobacteria bacterium]|jgi:murein DD-endopeptidase MepM/ murein hydrolase activator NlpD
MHDYNGRSGRPIGQKRSVLSRRILRLTAVLGVAAIACVSFFKLRDGQNVPTVAAEQRPPIALELPNASLNSPQMPGSQRTRIPFEPRTLTRNFVGDTTQSNASSDWLKVAVGPGDNLSLLFGRHGLSKKDLHVILKTGDAGKYLRKIKPGQAISVKADADGHIFGLIQELDYRRSLHINYDNKTYSASIVEIEPEIKYASVLAKISQSLFLDGQAAGLSDKTVMELTDIFGWDIDFVLDIRNGDQFSVVFEEIYKNDKKVKNGKILAAEFVNQGENLRAVYYANADGHAGYYSDEGEAMQKAFLRAPVNFTRISSGFNLKRRHPVLNTIRAHKGVDYAAPHGTPIRATANGNITHAGNKGGYGRTVVIKHGESYSTLFAHMSRFARGIKSGAKVKQGQTIGYVGKTGLATGPHLHYEFRINGVHRNPLSAALPKALPIEAKYIKDFQSKAAPLLAQLDELGDTSKSQNLVAKVDLPVPRGSSSRSEIH